MTRSSPASMACTGAVCAALFQCPLDDWGADPGSVCSGQELSLGSINQGRSLAGWWRRVHPGTEVKKAKIDAWDHLLIDLQQRPRAWIFDDPELFLKSGQRLHDVTFGCNNYLDYPLVVGGETQAPDLERNTIVRAGCSGPPEMDPSSWRRLEAVQMRDQRFCLEYRTNEKGDKALEGMEGVTKRICFKYEYEHDELELSYSENQEPLVHRRFRRYIPNANKQGKQKTGDQGGSSTTTASRTSPSTKEPAAAW